jgi:hypothetical protein
MAFALPSRLASERLVIRSFQRRFFLVAHPALDITEAVRLR